MKYIFANHPQTTKFQKQELSWTEFVDHLYDHARVPARLEDKEGTPVFGSCILRHGCYRRQIVNVVRMSSFVAFDLDRHWYIEEITHAIGGVEFVAYTTTKSQSHDKRWRIVVRLAAEYDAKDHVLFWEFFNERFLGELDPNTKDITRLSFVPRDWHNSMAEIHHREGFPFDVEALVASGWIPTDHDAAQAVQAAQTAIPTGPEITAIAGAERPLGDPIITPRMVAKFHTEATGGRYYRMLVRAAVRYKANGWHLDVHDLAAAAELVSKVDTRGIQRRAKHEAKNAICYVERNWPQIKASQEARDQNVQAANVAAMNDALKRWGLR